MAEVSGLDMVREIIGQINNLRRLVTINGKKFKWDGKKYVRAVDGKTFTKKELTSYVKDQQFRAPGVDNPRKDTSRPQKQTFETKAKNKLKSIKTNLKGEFNKTVGQGKNLVNNLKMRLSKPNAFGYEDTNQANAPKRSTKSSNQLKMNRYLNKNYTGGKKGIISGIAQPAAYWTVDQLYDRLARNIEGKQKMSINDYRAMRDKQIANIPNTLKIIRMHREANKPQRITNSRGRTVRTIEPEQTGGALGRSRQDPYINREPQVSYKPEKVVPGPNIGTDSTDQKETVDKVKIKKVKLNPNAPDMGYDTKKTAKKTDEPSKGFSWKPGMSERQIKSQIKTLKRKKTKASHALKIRRMERALAIKRAYGNINDKKVNKLLNNPATERELEES